MSRMINDWKPETRSLISALKSEGFTVHSGNNGEGDDFTPESFKTENAFLDELLACDECSLYVKHSSRAKTYWIFLVMGNSPGELVCDCSAPSEDVGAKALERAIDGASAKWEGKAQPKVESPY